MTDQSQHGVLAGAALAVRRVTPVQLATHRAVRLAMLLDTPLAFGSTFAREVALTDEQWRSRMEDSHGWLAFEDSLPVGSVTLFQAPDQPVDEAYLVAMWVAAHARGRGVADALVRALVDHARASGLRRLLLDVAVDNTRAAGFYQRAGFVATGRTGFLPHGPSVPEYEMELLLDGS
jgi:ribosomal protein S18 acetylase RimI-like enzyme